MNISETPPEELFDLLWLEVYEKSVDVLWWQLVRLNSSLLILERILFFPFDLFETNPHHFWRLIENALFESCVITIWRIAIDTDSQVLTISKLKNEIAEHVKVEYAEQLRAALKSLAFEEKSRPSGAESKTSETTTSRTSIWIAICDQTRRNSKRTRQYLMN